MEDKPFGDMAERIRQRRIELKLSLQDVANLTGMSKSTLQRYETGSIKNIPLKRLEAFASALQTSPEWIMDGEDWYRDIIKALIDNNSNGEFSRHKIPPQKDLSNLLDEYGESTELRPDFLRGFIRRSYLNRDEVNLIISYRNFTKEGKEKIKEYMSDLSENPKYSANSDNE